ncbi:hypothetical protein ABBQ32_012143 [Trebouxia sp. C0010 RCD-2024]
MRCGAALHTRPDGACTCNQQCTRRQLLRKQTGHAGWVTDLLYVPELRLLFSCSIDHTIRVWSDKGKQAQVVELVGPIFCLSWCKRKQWLLVGGKAQLHVYNVDAAAAGRAAVQRRAPPVTEAATVPGGPPLLAAVADDGNKVLVEAIPPLQGAEQCHTDIIRSIVCTDMGFIVTLSYDRAMYIYGEERMTTPTRVRKASAARFTAVAWDKANNWLLTGAADGCVKVWSQEGRILDELMHTSDQAAALCYVPATRNYWVTGQHGNIQAFDPRAPGDVTPFIKATSNLQGGLHVTQLRQPPGSDVVIACTAKRQLMLWRPNPGAAFRTFTARPTWMEAVLVVPQPDSEPSIVFSACADGHVLRWELDADLNADSYKVGEEMPLHDSNVLAMVYSQDLDALITASQDTTIRIHWQNLRGKGGGGVCTSAAVVWLSELKCMQHSPGAVSPYQCCRQRRVQVEALQGLLSQMQTAGVGHPDGLGPHSRAAVGAAAAGAALGGPTLPTQAQDDGAAESTKPGLDVVLSHEGRVTGLALLPDWALASVSHDRSIRLWDLHTFKPLKMVRDAHETGLQGIDYSPDRDELVTWAMDNFAYVWDAVRLTTKYALVGHSAEVTQARWVGFKQCWVTAGDDDTLRTWATDGTPLHQFAYMGGSVQYLFVDNMNGVVLVSMLDKATRAYDLCSKQPCIKYVGHDEVVRGVDYLPEKGLYITGSWDESLRLWHRIGHPSNTPKAYGGLPDARQAKQQQEGGQGVKGPELCRLPPLETPRALQDIKTDLVQLFLTNMASDEMGERQEVPLVDLSGLGSQLRDLDRRLVKDLEAVAEKIVPVKRGSKQGIPFSSMSRSARRLSRVKNDRQYGGRQLSIQSVESTKSTKSQV